MITKITATNWKSFEILEYKFQSLNILIGNNSSGKSNFLDLLEFISKVAKGASNEELNKIRGGVDYFKRIASDKIILKIELDNADAYLHEDVKGLKFIDNSEVSNSKDEEFQIGITEISNLSNKMETLRKDILSKREIYIDNVEFVTNNEDDIRKLGNYENEFQILKKRLEEKIEKIGGLSDMIKSSLSSITVLDPIPSLIRGTTKHENRELLKDCSNLISFVASMEEKEKTNIENKLVEYLKKLTFSEIQSVSFKFLGENKEFAQLYIEENGIKLHSDIISDGMLRFISIIVALMTQKTGGILAMEEIDNGIAPNQLKMLIDIVDEISAERQFDVVFTTHNHLLINYLGEEYMDFVFYVSKKDGKSNIKRIKDYPQYGKLSSYGKLGDLVDNEEVINILNAQGDVDEA